MFERPAGGARTLLLDVGRAPDAHRLEELESLALSAQRQVVEKRFVRTARLDPATYLGAGKVEEFAALLPAWDAQTVVVNDALSPVQQRNLEQRWQVRVLDRTELILEIFAQRAQSAEGKLQVELAQLQYMKTRLVRGWSHLERQRGGIGLRGGPGETQIEIDRRLIQDRIRRLTEKLERLKRQRATQRRQRKRRELRHVALVGYTNAGKTTLFNALTKAEGYAADQLFATLDPLVRRFWLPGVGAVTLSDTVGFVRDLPHELIAAFHATLEEVREADLLLLVYDAARENGQERQVVYETLAAIGAGDLPVLEVANKIDQIGASAELLRDAAGVIRAVRISAKRGGEDLALLRAALAERLAGMVHLSGRVERGNRRDVVERTMG